MYFKVRRINAAADDKDEIINMSKMGDISELRKIIQIVMKIKPEDQVLLYKGKQLVDDQKIIDYDIQLNDIVQLMVRKNLKDSDDDLSTAVTAQDTSAIDERLEPSAAENEGLTSAESNYYMLGDPVDVLMEKGGWFEGDVLDILQNVNSSVDGKETAEDDLIFVCKVYRHESFGPMQFKFNDIRPRSHCTYSVKELTVGMKVMINANTVDPTNRGYWYDFEITDIRNTQIKGSVYVNPNLLPVEGHKAKFLKEIFKIEKPYLISKRSINEGLPKPSLRKYPFNCNTCRDVDGENCNDCGCRICSKKDQLDKILLCDDCDLGYHTYCLDPPLAEVPADPEWYCPTCKVDDSEIVRAGEKLKASSKKAKLVSKKSNDSGTSRDWGRGMACVGRVTECTIVPKVHYGPIPGVEVGTCWKFRVQVSEAGVHRPHVAGIHGRESDGAYSLVLSGGYEDDLDNGNEFFYTGSGGRDLSGNKRVNTQSCDQKLTRMNKALAMNCNAKFNNTTGAEAKDWKTGKPVRVVRNYKLAKHSKYAPQEGNRYDGIYKVVKYYPEKGKSGFIVWRYILRRDDSSKAPWEKGAPEFPMLYPPGHLEARAENLDKSQTETTTKRKQPDILDFLANAKSKKPKLKGQRYVLSPECEKYIENDKSNKKLWDECLILREEGQKRFFEKVSEIFMCVCCQEVLFRPVTLECGHNICRICLKRSFKAEIYDCPYCRFSLEKDYNKFDINSNLFSALKILFPGYEAGRS